MRGIRRESVEPFATALMRPDETGELLRKDAASAVRIGATELPDPKMQDNLATVRRKVEQAPAILTVTVHGETSAERTCCAWGRAFHDQGDLSGIRLLSLKHQAKASTECPHAAKPHVRVSRLGSRLSGKLLQSASTLHLKCGETSLKSPLTERDDRTPKSRPFHRLTVYVMPSNDQRKQRSDVVALH